MSIIVRSVGTGGVGPAKRGLFAWGEKALGAM